MTTALEPGISERVAAMRESIVHACEHAGRDPAGVTVIAVSKTFPAAAVLAAMRAGLTDFGENYVQEGAAKADEVRRLAAAEGLPPSRFHFVGHLQSNKVREALKAFAILGAIDSEQLLRVIAGRSESRVDVMIHVNLAQEATKHGLSAEALPRLLETAREFAPRIAVAGLMTIPPLSPHPEASRPYFRALRRLADEHGLECLSMGMTGDFEAAVEEGATHIRVGRAIFGERV